MEISGPQGKFYLAYDSNGYYAYAFAQHVDVQGSPVVIRFIPPIAPTIDAGEIYIEIQRLLGAD